MAYEPDFTITPELLRLVTWATEHRAWIAGAVVDVPWLPALQRDSAARAAHSSTAIEGNALSLNDVHALARGDTIAAPPKSKAEVLNYLAAMRWIQARRPGEPIQERNLLHLHRLLTKGTLPADAVGVYKKKPNRVVDANGRMIYLPPPPDKAGPLTRQLLAWIQSQAGANLHPVVVSAIAHHRLVSIHPFSDGNGRIARALAAWLLHTRGFDTKHLFVLDEFFEKDRTRYYDKIQQARDLDDVLTYWIEYVTEGVVQTLLATRKRIESLCVQTRAPKMDLTRRQEDLLRFLRDHPRVKSPDMEKAFKISRARVAQIVKPLVDAGLVVREGRTRATSYRLP